MQKEIACNFWRRFLALANRGEDVSVVNPARDFTVSVRAGEYDHMPTEQYDTVLSDYEQLSAIWHDCPKAAAGDVLLDALRMTSINSNRLEELTQILADCSAETMYAMETEPDPPPHDIGECAMKYPEISRLTPKDIYTHLCQRVRGQEDNNRKSFSVDCSRVSVVLLGAFERLLENKSHNTSGIGFGAPMKKECDYGNTSITHDDLINAGMRREIAGRINRIVSLRPLSVEDYRAILMGPVLGDLQNSRRCHIQIDPQYADSLARQAMAAGLGVRWMRSQVINALDDLMFDEPEAAEYTIANTSISPHEMQQAE